jgi:release factor glutamine methyltransferase
MPDVRALPGLEAGVSIQQACKLMTEAFRAAAVEEAQTDARILVARTLGLNRAQIVSQGDRALSVQEAQTLSERTARRLAREPTSRILGRREFWGLDLIVTSAVLDPRPDTETVVELALDWITTRHLKNEKLRVLDIGTGSGALLLALLAELPSATGVATDISLDALKVARSNAQHLGFGERATFVACNFTSALRGPFDLVVSNPPYISSAEISTLAPEVRDHDPLLALDGGEDGLNAYRAIAADALRLLTPRGRLVVELGQGQAEPVSAIMRAAGLTIETPIRRDLAGINRALCATAP